MSHRFHKDAVECIELFVSEMDDLQPYRFLARAAEVHNQALKRVKLLRAHISDIKHRMQSIEDEASSNILLVLEMVTYAIENELLLYVSMKADDGNQAWDHFVYAQKGLESALVCVPAGDPFNMTESIQNNLDRINTFENNLFPAVTYLSPGMEVLESTCSICGASWKTCNHKQGKPYMGEFCHRVISKADLHEVSIVFDSEDKRRRVMYLGDLDVMTYRKKPTDQ